MANDLYKVQILVPKYGFLESYYYRIPHVLSGSYLDKLKSDVKQRYPFLDLASFKISWLDHEGDKVAIFNEEDFLTLKLLKGRKLFIDVGFNEVQEANNPPGKLDMCDTHKDIENAPENKECLSSPISSNSRKAANKRNIQTRPLPKISVHGKSRELTLPILKINKIKQKEAVTFIVRDNDKFEDTPSPSIIDANSKNNDSYTEDIHRGALSPSSSKTISPFRATSPLIDEFQHTSHYLSGIFRPISDTFLDAQDKSSDNYSEDVQGACCLPLLSDIIINESSEKRKSSLAVSQNYSAEKTKKAVRFSLPNEYESSVNEETFEPRNIKVDPNLNASEDLKFSSSFEHLANLNVPEDLMYDSSVEPLDPVIQESLIKLAEMGFYNQDRSVIKLLESVNGDITEFFDKYGVEDSFGRIVL